jgi:hypothetical protein
LSTLPKLMGCRRGLLRYLILLVALLMSSLCTLAVIIAALVVEGNSSWVRKVNTRKDVVDKEHLTFRYYTITILVSIEVLFFLDSSAALGVELAIWPLAPFLLLRCQS